MKTIEESLDYILVKLKGNWNNSGGRKYLECEKMLSDLGYPPDFRKHEFFMRLIDRLRKDDYAEFTKNDIGMRSWIDYYQQETLITVEGFYFITNPKGGYEKTAANVLKNDNRKDFREKMLLYGTWAVALGAIALVVWEVLKTFVFEH